MLYVFVATEGNTDELKIIFLEEEIKEMKKTLKEERLRNKYLTELLEQAQKLKVQPQWVNIFIIGLGVPWLRCSSVKVLSMFKEYNTFP